MIFTDIKMAFFIFHFINVQDFLSRTCIVSFRNTIMRKNMYNFCLEHFFSIPLSFKIFRVTSIKNCYSITLLH